MKKISKKLFTELYDYFWLRGDLKECNKLKLLFSSKENKKSGGKYLTRAQAFKEIYK